MNTETQPTLEELASSITVEQRQPAQSAQVAMPEFENVEDSSKWAAQTAAKTDHRLNALQSELSAEKEKTFVETRLKALDSAVSDISADVPISKLMIEGVFHAKYARDTAFQKIFDNRESNPDAYKKALNILKDEIKRESAIKYDPDTEETNRTLKQLHKSARSPAKPDTNEKFKGMSNNDFEQEWRKLLQS